MLHDPNRQVKFLASQILFAAAKYFETHGWCQHAMRFKERVCMFGAICEVSREIAYGPDLMVDAEIARRLRKVTKCQGIAGWNDAPGRTKQQVMKTLTAAAKL